MENFTDEHSFKHDQVVMKINNLIYVQTQLHYSHQRELKIEETCKPSCKTIKNSAPLNDKMIRKGDYDIITLDENDELQIDDISEHLESNNDQKIKTLLMSTPKNYVIKCNLCNYTFLTVEQFQDHHHQGENHKKDI